MVGDDSRIDERSVQAAEEWRGQGGPHEGGGGGGELVVWRRTREEAPLIREERKNGLVTGGRVVVPRPPFSGHDEGGGEGVRLLSLVQKYGKTQSEDDTRLLKSQGKASLCPWGALDRQL